MKRQSHVGHSILNGQKLSHAKAMETSPITKIMDSDLIVEIGRVTPCAPFWSCRVLYLPPCWAQGIALRSLSKFLNIRTLTTGKVDEKVQVLTSPRRPHIEERYRHGVHDINQVLRHECMYM